MKTTAEILVHVRKCFEEAGVHVPDPLPYKVRDAGDGVVSRYARIRRREGVFLFVESEDGEGATPPHNTVNIRLKRHRSLYGPPFIVIRADADDSGRVYWSVVVDRDTPTHFSHFRGHFLPHAKDENFGLGLSDEEGGKWLTRLAQDFLTYTPS